MLSLDPLISKLVTLLESEASLIANVRDELREMQLELETMRSFLKDADSAASQTELQATWVSQVRDSVFEIQDIIDEFEYHRNKYQALGKFRSFVHKSVHFPQNLWLKRRLASKLQKVKSAAEAISKRRRRFEVDGSKEMVPLTNPHNWLKAHHESALYLKDDEVVGFENAKNKMRGWLLSEEMERIVISVLGPGGSGKTTLVANVYNNPTIKQHFDCHAWVTVSQTYEIGDILAAIIQDSYKSRKEKVPNADVSRMNYRSSLDLLVDYLKNKRYVIVLDDIWDLDLWKQLCIALPNNMQGSRVIISTRSQEVASSSFGVQSYVQHNEPLPKDEAFYLFCKKAFSDKACPDNLKATALKLVDRCEGLPLALVALGGALFNKSESEWRMVDSSLTWQLANNPGLQKMTIILLLSFHALPHRLKLCFLYCSVFPEDHLMQSEKLKWLWLAEGFLEEVGDLTPEQVAEHYVVELVRRSLLQVVEFDSFGGPETCKMHDILREIAISISMSEKFCSVCKDKKEVEANNSHIVSIQGKLDLQSEPRMPKSLSKVRSLFLFITKEVYLEFIELPREFQLLRVLNLEDLNIDKLPNEIVSCYNLRYLNMANTEVRELPKSIGNLTQLRTLNLMNTNIQVIPPGIANLHNLRHLMVTRKCCPNVGNFSSFDNAVQVTSSIVRLENLHILNSIKVNVDFVGKLGCLTNLRELNMDGVTEEVEEEMCLAINKMEYLNTLSLNAADEKIVLRLEPLSSIAPRLKLLNLHGKLQKVPIWFQCLRNVTCLYLGWTRFEGDFLISIEALPNLVKLYLWNAYVGEQLYFGKGFQKLRELEITELPQLNKITVKNGVMPNIEKLVIRECKELKTVPKGIKYLASLRSIHFKDVSSELVSQIRRELARCKHQPKIFFF